MVEKRSFIGKFRNIRLTNPQMHTVRIRDSPDLLLIGSDQMTATGDISDHPPLTRGLMYSQSSAARLSFFECGLNARLLAFILAGF